MKSLLKVQAEHTECVILIHKSFEFLKELKEVCKIGLPFEEM